ncbi:uncharacterized protein MONOS_6892 [Monocercomonoides exilis]|uniref:uncharacterized protein n=1 Tax=Monocercomonoides exilis TaxID=2049356 RepID=UPI0035594F57|nr:hypothetical protein MONOS_6892 [Monocercomonoides exilis]|eukprot:MONOS_6892.1-p1 / transcript=MONOS_6892.1 / gene=MONOS_6892 / organism=Monocercomonoides_exilis_PA203 / gene_product=unspecified product / transcript_product=unspecified product / location=Mono_scaffold00226:2543-3467(-) / protein_length=169 / sequence_SO=supercontig / SO=protein_coding / is_pseudo=false
MCATADLGEQVVAEKEIQRLSGEWNSFGEESVSLQRNIRWVWKKRNEGQDVKVVIVIGVRGIRASIGCARSKRRLGELDGKEGLIDLGWDIGAPEKEVLSSEGVVQGYADVENGDKDWRSFSGVDAVYKEVVSFGRHIAHIDGEMSCFGSAIHCSFALSISHKSWPLA